MGKKKAGKAIEPTESAMHGALVEQVGPKRCWESRHGYETRLAVSKLEVMEATSHLSKTDLMNVWKIFHLIHINGIGNAKKQEQYIREQDILELDRDEYESIVGLAQNRYRDELGCLFNANGQTHLTFEELCDLFSSMSKIAKPAEKAKLAFCLYDIDLDNKLDKTDLGNMVLRLVFDFPPLLETSWEKVEPKLEAHQHSEQDREKLQVIVNELVQGLRNSEPPTELDPMEALVMAVDINAYVEEALDEASHDVWNPNSPIDDRAIHFPEFQRAVDRNPDFAINFTIPIVPPVVPTAVTKRARQTFNIVADLGGAGSGIRGSKGEGPGWLHPRRPTLLAERVTNFARLKSIQKSKKKGLQLGDGSPSASDEFADFDHSDGNAWSDFKHWVKVKRELMKQQDPNPLWRGSLLKMEGAFGAGIGSVFKLYRWFFIMNLYIAATWGVWVIFPVLAQEYYGMEMPTVETLAAYVPTNYTEMLALGNAAKEALMSGSSPDEYASSANVTLAMDQAKLAAVGCDVAKCYNPVSTCIDFLELNPVLLCGACNASSMQGTAARCGAARCCTFEANDYPLNYNGTLSRNSTNAGMYTKDFDFDWFYYGGYHWSTSFVAGAAGYRVDMAYVMVVLLLYLVNIVAVIRELADNVTASVRSESEKNIESMRFTLTKELFGGYKHGLATNAAVQAHLTGFRNELKSVMAKKMEKRLMDNQDKVLWCIPLQTSRRMLGLLAAFGLVVISGGGIAICLLFRTEMDAINPLVQPAVLTFIKQVIPLLVRKTVALEKYVDAEQAMKATVQRVYFLKMFSLVNIFINNLNQLNKSPDNSHSWTHNETEWAAGGALLLTSMQEESCVETEIGKAYLKLIIVDMIVGISTQFKLYPQWRAKVKLDRAKVVRAILVKWLSSIQLEEIEHSLRDFFGESLCGKPINLETVREMDLSQENINFLRIQFQTDELEIDDAAVERFVAAVKVLKAQVADTGASDDFFAATGGDSSDDEADLAARVKGGGGMICDRSLGLSGRLQGGAADNANGVDNPLVISEDAPAVFEREERPGGAPASLSAAADVEDPELGLPPSGVASEDGVDGLDDGTPMTAKEIKAQKKLEKAQAKAAAKLLKQRAVGAAHDDPVHAEHQDRSDEHPALDQSTIELIDQRNKEEYDTDRAAQAAIDMMYRQALIWVGASFCPVLPFFGLLNIFVQFMVQYWTMFKACKPPKTPWSADKTMFFFMKLVLLTLLISGGPIVFVLTRDSMSCGPHCSYIQMESNAPWLANDHDKGRCNPSTLPPAFVGAADRWMADRMPFVQRTFFSLLTVMLTAPVMFSILFVTSIVIYFMLKTQDAMKKQINVMGAMLTEEEKERYDLITTNTAAGVTLVMPDREGMRGMKMGGGDDVKQGIPEILRHGLRTRVVDQDNIDARVERANKKGLTAELSQDPIAAPEEEDSEAEQSGKKKKGKKKGKKKLINKNKSKKGGKKKGKKNKGAPEPEPEPATFMDDIEEGRIDET